MGRFDGGRGRGDQPAVHENPLVKQNYKEPEAPRRVSRVDFGLMSGKEILKISELNVVNKHFYKVGSREPELNGVVDPRLGVCFKNSKCATCGLVLEKCLGHFGHIALALPVFHIGYFKWTIKLLQQICKSCGRVLLGDKDKKVNRRSCLETLANREVDALVRQELVKRIFKRCRDVRTCPYCGAFNGNVKKISGFAGLRIIHDVYQSPKSVGLRQEFFDELTGAVAANPELAQYQGRATVDITPSDALEIFLKVPDEDLPLLWLSPDLSRPERLIFTHLPVPPVCIRPSVKMDAGASNEDDLTCKLASIVTTSNSIRENMEKGQAYETILASWDSLNLEVAQYMNGALPNSFKVKDQKPIKGLSQRLKGKEGRFRKHLSGKRVNFSARTVISPDPNLEIDEVAVPLEIAMTLTYPERVTKVNIEYLRMLVRNGPKKYPGANVVHMKNSKKCSLEYGDREEKAKSLRFGDVVARHLRDGDIVLFNRQPSLHKMSIMSHRVRVMEWRTFRFNECVCSPYNADFDGDEMNLHVPQTEEARAEAWALMSVVQNLCTPKSGSPLVSACQDFLTASFLLTQRDSFLTREEFCALCVFMSDGNEAFSLPEPAIIRPVTLWTGKQVVAKLLQSAIAASPGSTEAKIHLELKEKNFNDKSLDYYPDALTGIPGRESMHACMCDNDGFVYFHNSELVCGNIGKPTLGSSSKGLICALIRDACAKAAAMFMIRLTKLTTRWLSNSGLSIGIDDVTPSQEMRQHILEVQASAYEKCGNKIEMYDSGKLQLRPGCDEVTTLEVEMKSILDSVRTDMGVLQWLKGEQPNNPTFIMATCGSKGSEVNICQMMCCVGQQIVNGARMPDGFIQRTLPHFPLNDQNATTRGFVANSFFSGLQATEFFFHTMGGRQGLVDTAVKTAQTGYMQRRLIKGLEGLALQYDSTVRAENMDIIQFSYGSDNLNPAFMEDSGRPINFSRLINAIRGERDAEYRRNLLANVERYNKALDLAKPNPSSGIVLEDDWMSPAEVREEMEAFVNSPHIQTLGAAGAEFVHECTSMADHLATTLETAYATNGLLGPEVLAAFEAAETDNAAASRAEAAAQAADAAKASAEDARRAADLTKQAAHTKAREAAAANATLFRADRAMYENLVKWRAHCEDSSQRSWGPYQASAEWRTQSKNPESKEHRQATKLSIDRMHGVSRATFEQLVDRARGKYLKAMVHPGEALGAVAAQSIGEPATQMTLQTFHFAGVASMNVTMGVPRVTEIINAVPNISTPIIEAYLDNDRDERKARVIKARIEKTALGEIARSIHEIYEPHAAPYLEVRIDMSVVQQLFLPITLESIAAAVQNDSVCKKLKISDVEVDEIDECIRVHASKVALSTKAQLRRTQLKKLPSHAMSNDAFSRAERALGLELLKKRLPEVIVSGISSVNRAIVNRDEKDNSKLLLFVEGTGLLKVLGTQGIDPIFTKTNHIIEMNDVLGIEAARNQIVVEIEKIYSGYGLSVDERHLMLLADLMTFKGQVRGMTRFGLQETKDSVFMLASFEKTTDHLFNAAVNAKSDAISGVSECIIMGIPISIGTGMCELMYKPDARSSVEARRVTAGKHAAWHEKYAKNPRRGSRRGQRPVPALPVTEAEVDALADDIELLVDV